MSDLSVQRLDVHATAVSAAQPTQASSLQGIGLDSTRRMFARLEMRATDGAYQVTVLFQGGGYLNRADFATDRDRGLVRGRGTGVNGDRVELEYFVGDATARLSLVPRGAGVPSFEWELPMQAVK
jgi:hypothetical protein